MRGCQACVRFACRPPRPILCIFGLLILTLLLYALFRLVLAIAFVMVLRFMLEMVLLWIVFYRFVTVVFGFWLKAFGGALFAEIPVGAVVKL